MRQNLAPRQPSINLPAQNRVFTTVNRNETMNTYAMIVAGLKGAPAIHGTAAHAYAGNPRHRPDETSSGIRGAGQ